MVAGYYRGKRACDMVFDDRGELAYLEWEVATVTVCIRQRKLEIGREATQSNQV